MYRSHNRPTTAHVVHSRLPVYKEYYEDGFGDVIRGLFTRIAPKIAPIAKELSMKAIGVIRDKGIGAIADLAGRAFNAAKKKIMSIVRRKQKQSPEKNIVY